MGNNHDGLNGQLNGDNKNSNNKKYKNGLDKGNNSEDEKDAENNNQILSEYDKELSHMLFDDDSDQEKENNKIKKPKRKKTLKEELDDYAEQVAEEKFMEEINRSKSIRKENKNDDSNDDDDDEEDDYAAFKRWKAKQKKKKKKKDEKEKDTKSYNIKTVNNKNDNNNDDNLNINKEIKNKKNKKTDEKKRVNSSDKLNNFKNNIKEKNAKAKKKSNKKEKEKEQDDDNKIILSAKDEEFIKQSMRNFCIQNEMKTNTFRNNVPNVDNILNNNENKNIEKIKYSTNTYNPKDIKSKTVMIPKKNNEKDKKKKSAEKEKPKKSIFSFFKKKDNNIISKKITEKMNKENIRTVTLYMKNGNNKYEEGLQLCGFRNYNNALVCFAQSRNSFLQLSKLMNNNPRDYPPEFRKIINEKILEKLKLVNQSIRECNDYIRNGKNLKNNTTSTNDILKNLNFKQDNKINNNFSQIDDSFNFNSNEPDPNPVFRNRKPNQNTVNKNIHQEEDSEMDAKVESEIMITNPGIKFSDIIGMQEMKKTLYEIIIVPSIRPDFFTGIRKPQRGILLFGPPGTGKTMIAKAIASECKSTFFNISASSLTSKWVGESEKTVKSLFKLAYKKSPSIIFIDEIDSILSKRTENENEATKRLKTEFLIQFDGLGSNNNAKLLVIAATNRPMDLDEALLRRLPKRVYCGPLDQNGRFDFIKKVINKVETNLSDKDIMEIAKMTKGYSNSDLKELCKEAAFQPVRELTMEQILKIKKFRPLVKNDLVLAVNKIRGSLNNKIIGELLKWNEQFGGI